MQNRVIRAASHAGSWYNQNKVKLDEELQINLGKAQIDPKYKDKPIKAIIGPHAGFRYSGPVAAWSYKYLSQINNPKLRIFLLGPSHRKYLEGVSLSNCEVLETPIGNLEVDINTITQLKTEVKQVNFTKKNEEQEHSLEMHMPFIRKVFGENIAVVPIIVGQMRGKMLQDYGLIFSKYFDDENTIFIISSDFCHWGDHFDYQPYEQGSGQIWQYIKGLDHQGMNHIEKQDLKGFSEYIKETGNTICGENPIKLLLSTIAHSKQKLETKFVRYDQSEPVKKPNQSSVSYASSITYRLD